MPLRCFDPSVNRSVLAFDLSPEQWRALQRENRSARHLRMPCCQAQVTLKRSRRGTPFFAHKSVGQCATAPETEAHLRLKRIAVDAARTYGWDAETEVAGRTAKGEQWRADVFAQKARSRVAIELQWSSQTNEETLCRQARYAESGVRCLWLFRHRGFPVSRDLPAVRVDGNPDEGFVAFIPTGIGGAKPVGARILRRGIQQKVSLRAAPWVRRDRVGPGWPVALLSLPRCDSDRHRDSRRCRT